MWLAQCQVLLSDQIVAAFPCDCSVPNGEVWCWAELPDCSGAELCQANPTVAYGGVRSLLRPVLWMGIQYLLYCFTVKHLEDR